MCGIVGYFGNFSKDKLTGASLAVSHRGPDDNGVYYDDSCGVGLAHRRLSIIDLSQSGHQPMMSDDGDVVIIFNGEIYNYRELRKNLEMEGFKFRGSSDTEVLLKLYISKGDAMLKNLNGIFSFAIWSLRDRKLFIARDSFGVKPLYYSSIGSNFAFSSEIKSLLYLVPEERSLDIQAINRYLTYLWCPGDGTPFKHIRKLSPGEAIDIRDGRINRKWDWYRLPVFGNISYQNNVKECIQDTDKTLRQAVHRQMLSDVPLGSFLSGGLDSSAVVVFARELNPDIRCFTIDVSGGQEEDVTDDLPYARRVAKLLKVPLDIITIESSKMADDLEKMVAQLDEPLADPASLNVYYISKLARENGIKVLLSGTGGDDLFTGYRRHYALYLEKYLDWLPKTVKNKIKHISTRLDARKPSYRRISKMFSGIELDGDVRLVNYFRWIEQCRLKTLYSTNSILQLENNKAETPMLEYLKPLSDEISDIERMLALEQRFFLTDHNLIYTDKMSMAASVEVRVPFLDAELVNLTSSIPPKYKQRGSTGKWILKKVMEQYLPNDLIYRKKTGFGAPLRRWIHHDLRNIINDLLSYDSIKSRGLFSPEAVNKLISDNINGITDASYIIFSLLCIEIWCRKYMDIKYQ